MCKGFSLFPAGSPVGRGAERLRIFASAGSRTSWSAMSDSDAGQGEILWLDIFCLSLPLP